MTDRLKVRKAADQDLPILVDFILRMIKLNAEFDPLLSVEEESEGEVLSFVKEGLRDPKALFLVAELGGSVAGVLRAGMVDRRFYAPRTVGQIDNIYVMPEFRRKEVGSVLLARADEELRKRGAQMILVEFPVQNYIASSFYTKEGFRPLMGVHARETDMRRTSAVRLLLASDL